jgi:hypothetical protein
VNVEALVPGEVKAGEEVTPELGDMEDMAELNWPGWFPIQDRLKDYRTNPSRIDDRMICQSNTNSVGGVGLEPVAVRGHVRGGTSVSNPVKVSIKLERGGSRGSE